MPKTAPKGVVFCRFFEGTETYAVIMGSSAGKRCGKSSSFSKTGLRSRSPLKELEPRYSPSSLRGARTPCKDIGQLISCRISREIVSCHRATAKAPWRATRPSYFQRKLRGNVLVPDWATKWDGAAK